MPYAGQAAAVQELNKMDGGYEPEVVMVTTDFSFAALLKELKSTPLVRGNGSAENVPEKDRCAPECEEKGSSRKRIG